ncbi:unnamed protein product, partial [Discosporangium mesarthrocarpum]
GEGSETDADATEVDDSDREEPGPGALVAAGDQGGSRARAGEGEGAEGRRESSEDGVGSDVRLMRTTNQMRALLPATPVLQRPPGCRQCLPFSNRCVGGGDGEGEGG